MIFYSDSLSFCTKSLYSDCPTPDFGVAAAFVFATISYSFSSSVSFLEPELELELERFLLDFLDFLDFFCLDDPLSETGFSMVFGFAASSYSKFVISTSLLTIRSWYDLLVTVNSSTLVLNFSKAVSFSANFCFYILHSNLKSCNSTKFGSGPTDFSLDFDLARVRLSAVSFNSLMFSLSRSILSYKSYSAPSCL